MPAQVKPFPPGLLLHAGASSRPSRVSTLEAQRSRQRVEGWFREHFDTLWRFAARLGVPDALRDDIVQEAFITAERRAADIPDGSERKFMTSTIVKLAANSRRRQATRQEPLDPSLISEEPPDAEQQLQTKQLRRWLDHVLDQLPPEQRTVFVLYELEDHTVPEIAELLSLAIGTVASRLGRARARFSRAAARLQSNNSLPVEMGEPR